MMTRKLLIKRSKSRRENIPFVEGFLSNKRDRVDDERGEAEGPRGRFILRPSLVFDIQTHGSGDARHPS
jgi:hypothetical protein